jgi:23S rRNA C2498 (ribose-2'-O)-methylase RlmM
MRQLKTKMAAFTIALRATLLKTLSMTNKTSPKKAKLHVSVSASALSA